ncbi:MAG: RNA methyltransferase [Spirochaetaceae bacterium]|nr:RNA methyltransferase [Spirochaetaceae bacterium]
MKETSDQELIEYFKIFVTDNRLEKMEKVLAMRTRYLTVALENIYQPHNTSAVLRSCDGFGIQNVHIIENSNVYRENPGVSLGTSQWLTLNKYRNNSENSLNAINTLKKDGYRIVATTPHYNDKNLEEFDLTKGKIALFFGTEMHGLSNIVLENADEYMKIPMYGFVESFNISVSCAISLHNLSHRLRQSNIKWELTHEEKEDVLLEWMRNSVKNAASLEEEFYRRR